jgi:hypothetical protein
VSQRELRWRALLGCVLLMRLLFPFFNSPLRRLYSDPLRHWQTGQEFLHPTVMGSGDPYFYQLWLFVLQRIAGDSRAAILTGCALLCAAMPYGWYRALREFLPRLPALRSSVLIGLWPAFLGIYGYFMTETMVLTLTGFGFALTLRAARKRNWQAFAAACAVWLAAIFSRIVILPVAVLCLLWALALQPQKRRCALAALLLTASVAIPAGLHTRSALGYFAPLGNLYLNEIYHASSNKDIQIDYGSQGAYRFGSPSYYNPTFYPFSNWTTFRQGVFMLRIDTRHGRADWRRALQQIPHQPWRTRARDFGENLCYLFFGQAWPDNDRRTLVGSLAVWMRWLLLPIVLWTVVAVMQRLYRGREWLVPGCALMSLLLLAMQREGIMEGRYRKPIEPLFLVSIALAWHARSRAQALR